MARKWLEGAAGLRQETLTQPFTKRTDKRADELISASMWDDGGCNRPCLCNVGRCISVCEGDTVL